MQARMKGKIFWGQKSTGGKSATTVCGVDWQLHQYSLMLPINILMATPNRSRPQPALENDVRDCGFN